MEVADLNVYDAPTYDGPDLSAQEMALPPPGFTGDPAVGPMDVAVSGPPGGGQAGELAADIPPLPPAPTGWYRCDAPTGFYPAVPSCGASWSLEQPSQ